MNVTAVGLVERVEEVRARVAAAGGDPERVKLVAVTKGFGAEVAAEALAAGLTELGENYAQELLAKAASDEVSQAVAAAGTPVHWHFLGPPQRNKIARLAPVVSLWQGIDRPAAAAKLAAVRPGAPIMIQVNVVGDPAKTGCPPAEVTGLVDEARRQGLDVQGLMCVGPADDRQGAQKAFAALARMARDVGVQELSMGMSDDFELAVREGSTMIRLGRTLFGPRPGGKRVRR